LDLLRQPYLKLHLHSCSCSRCSW